MHSTADKQDYEKAISVPFWRIGVDPYSQIVIAVPPECDTVLCYERTAVGMIERLVAVSDLLPLSAFDDTNGEE